MQQSRSLPTRSTTDSIILFDGTSLAHKCQPCTRLSSPIPTPNVPLIDMPRFRASPTWSLSDRYHRAGYFASHSYVIDALSVSVRNPTAFKVSRRCAIDREQRQQRFIRERIKHFIFNNQLGLNEIRMDGALQSLPVVPERGTARRS